MLRNACGSTTVVIVWRVDRPSDRAAARWLSCTLSIPARKTSATYAEYDNTSATVPQMTGSDQVRGTMRRPGTPKPIRKIEQDHGDAPHDVGVDVPRSRTGNSAGVRTLRARATSSRHDQDQRRRPQQDLDVEPERLEQPRERVGEHVAVEERLAHLLPARRAGHEHDQRRDDDDRARGRDDRRADVAAHARRRRGGSVRRSSVGHRSGVGVRSVDRDDRCSGGVRQPFLLDRVEFAGVGERR